MPFGNCIFTFDLSLAADGRLWLDDVRVGGTSPCNDTWACSPTDAPGWADDVHFRPQRASRYPWEGRLEMRGEHGARGYVRACLDTCLGRFEGRMEIEVLRKGGSWVMRARPTGVGASGLAIAGEWSLEPAAFAIQ
jgi:hypothetical protein